MHPFRAAVEAHSIDQLSETLSDDVTFLSPVSFTPYHGRPLVTAILARVITVLEDFHYVDEISDPAAGRIALIFKATTDGREVHGCDFLTLDPDGRVIELCVMLRPLSAVQAVAARMAIEFEAIKRELGG